MSGTERTAVAITQWLISSAATAGLAHGDATATCGLCDRPLTTLTTTIGRHVIEVRSCGPCGWHTRWIDGIAASQDDLLGGLRVDAPYERPDRGRAVATWDGRA